jgi:cytochrome P450
MTATLDFDPLSLRWSEDPWPVHRRLRDRAPIHWAPESGMFCVSRHEDVVRVLKDPHTFSSSAMNSVLTDLGPIGPRVAWGLLRFLLRTRVNPFEMQRRGSLISIDPPRHDALRAIVNRGFVPRRIAAWEGRARQLVAEALRGLRPGERFDVVERLAVPLPVTLIAEMLGVEPERRRDFKRWSDAIIAVSSGPARGNPVALLGELSDLFVHLRDQARARRREPRDDLVSLLVDASRPDSLDELDVIQFVVLLLVAGNETTTNLIGNAVLALLEHPEVLERVAGEPALVPRLVEEVLRWDSPIQLVFRQATREVALRDVRIPRDATLALLLGSANRDERAFPEPDRLDLDRDTRSHLAFGLGPHFCMGAALARLEARVALEALVPELVGCKLAAPPTRVESFLVRGPAALVLERSAGPA